MTLAIALASILAIVGLAVGERLFRVQRTVLGGAVVAVTVAVSAGLLIGAQTSEPRVGESPTTVVPPITKSA